MDIWAWVNDHLEELAKEDADLARQLDALSGWACDGQHGRVDAALPAITARLRALNKPWLEVFARHWGLQSRILHRQDARHDALREAVDLAERAHRDDALDCPQSICVTQDLCAAYGVVDGRGHAEARIAAANEALARITPAWPCYRCIQGELVSALLDQRRPELALERIAAAEQAIRTAGGDDDLGLARSRALIQVGRLEEALDVARTYANDGQGASGVLAKSLRIANVLVRLGRLEEGLERLPTRADIGDEVEDYAEWIEVNALLVRDHQHTFDPERVADLNAMVRRLSLHCAHRDTVESASRLADVAIDDGAWAYADAWCTLAETHLPELVAPYGEDVRLHELRARIDAKRPQPYGTDADAALLVFRHAAATGEVSFGSLVATSRAVPAAGQIVEVTAERWLALGWPEQAHGLVERALEASSHPPLIRLRLRTLYDLGDLDELRERFVAWAEHPHPMVRLHVRWFRSLLAEREGRFTDAAADAAWIWTHLRDSASPAVLRRHAAMLQLAGELEAAADVLDELVALPDASREDHWFRMEIATLLERWSTVRASSAELGIELEGEGFIDDPAGSLKLDTPQGTVWASRIGPCHARVDSITGPGRDELHHSVWAFDPFSGDGAEPTTYTVHRCLRAGDFVSVTLDGVELSEAGMERIVDVVRAAKGAAYRASGDGYRLVNGDRTVEAAWIKVALPADTDAFPSLAAVFDDLAKTHDPLVWPELLDVLAQPEEADRHRRIALAWGM